MHLSLEMVSHEKLNSNEQKKRGKHNKSDKKVKDLNTWCLRCTCVSVSLNILLIYIFMEISIYHA